MAKHEKPLEEMTLEELMALPEEDHYVGFPVPLTMDDWIAIKKCKHPAAALFFVCYYRLYAQDEDDFQLNMTRIARLANVSMEDLWLGLGSLNENQGGIWEGLNYVVEVEECQEEK